MNTQPDPAWIVTDGDKCVFLWLVTFWSDQNMNEWAERHKMTEWVTSDYSEIEAHLDSFFMTTIYQAIVPVHLSLLVTL